MLPEIALNSILVIFFILFPGIVFRRFYYASQFATQFTKGEWGERFVISVFWGIVSQVTTFYFLGFIPKVNLFLKEKEIIDSSMQNIFFILFQEESSKEIFFIYIFCSIVISGLMGYIGHKVIRTLKLDIHFSSLRYSNTWHYCLSGELKSLKVKGKVLFTWIDLVIKEDDGDNKNKMIQGVLMDYSINPLTGDLDYLYLQKAQRYSHSECQFKNISSDVFVVPFKNVIDLNIRYKIEENNLSNKKIYSILYAIFVIVGLVVAITTPWIYAGENVGIWRVILSYIPIFICYFFIMVSLMPNTKELKNNVISRFILIVVASLFLLIVKWIIA